MTSNSVFLRYLERLVGMVDMAQAHALTRNLQPDELLGARLASDMLPFSTQVAIGKEHFDGFHDYGMASPSV